MNRRCAVVTGAGQGIGHAIARRLASEGWRVWCVDIAEHRLNDTVEGLCASGGDAVAQACDISRTEAIDELWRRIDADRPNVSALINNAGIFPRSTALQLTEADWTRTLAVNLSGSFFMAQRAAGRFVDDGGGRVISIASGQAYRPGPGSAAYAASKAGLVNLSRALAEEWGPLGIRVNTVVPGLTDTAQPRAVRGDEDFRKAAARTPLRRLGTPEDVAGVVSFLLSDDASHITGQAIAVNGGRVMV